MRYIYYIPEAELIYIGEDKHPGNILNKLRRDMYKYLNYAVQRPRNIELITTLLEHGGVSHMKFIMTQRIPFLISDKLQFYSYKDDDKIKSWLQQYPGKNVKPIITSEEYDYATVNRYNWENLPDMYP